MNSVYLSPCSNWFNPRPVLAADKPCWSGFFESRICGDCKVLGLVVNSMFCKSGDEQGRNGDSGANSQFTLS